jgi:hypothetical protein
VGTDVTRNGTWQKRSTRRALSGVCVHLLSNPHLFSNFGRADLNLKAWKQVEGRTVA